MHATGSSFGCLLLRAARYMHIVDEYYEWQYLDRSASLQHGLFHHCKETRWSATSS